MTDELDPTARSRDSGTGGETAGMDPEGLMPADTSLHETGGELTQPHDQPAEGGREQDDLPGADTGVPDVG